MGVNEVKLKIQLDNIERRIYILENRINIIESRIQTLEEGIMNITKKLLYG